MPAPSRKECIVKALNTCKFVVTENSKASGAEPIYEIAAFSDVDRYSSQIERVAKETGIEARLIRAIIYMETTHGYYDAPLSFLGANKSILPMNVNVEYWGNTFGDRKSMSDPYNNIKAGAEILKRIMSNLPPRSSIRQVSTLYNNINAHSVSNYGARVEKIYATQPWLSGAKK